MSWMTPRQEIFSLAGPFIARRSQPAGTLQMEQNAIYTAADFAKAGVSERNLRQMYAANWIDMATLTPAERELLAASGHSEADYFNLGIKERHLVLAHARLGAAEDAPNAPQAAQDARTGESGDIQVSDTQNQENAPDGPQNGSDGIEPDASAVVATAGVEGEAGAATVGEQSTAPADTVAVAFKSFGFGQYFEVNAAGEKLGSKLSKADAEGRAAAASLPLLGQNDPLPGAGEA